MQNPDTPSPPNPPALAVILARAGSKGLPRKNGLSVAGKPMLAWSIEHALESRCIDRVLLSTDGPELAEIARRYPGVEVVMRPEELASDTATIDAAVRHAVNQHLGMHSAVVILYGNIPVRPTDLTDRAVEKLYDTGCDSVQSVCPVGKHHPFWMKTVDPANGKMKHYIDNDVYRRQDLPEVYGLDGGVIAVTRESLFTVIEGEPHAFLGGDRQAIITRSDDVIDVDNEIDRVVAEAMLNRRAHSIRTAG